MPLRKDGGHRRRVVGIAHVRLQEAAVSLAARRKVDAAAFKVARCEIRNGRRYVDGVDAGPAQPDTALSQRNRDAAQRGADRRGRRR